MAKRKRRKKKERKRRRGNRNLHANCLFLVLFITSQCKSKIEEKTSKTRTMIQRNIDKRNKKKLCHEEKRQRKGFKHNYFGKKK